MLKVWNRYAGYIVPLVFIAGIILLCMYFFGGCNSGKNIRKDIVENKSVEQLTDQTLILKMMDKDVQVAREMFCLQALTAKKSDAMKVCEAISNVLNSRAIKKDCSKDGVLQRACVDLYFRRK